MEFFGGKKFRVLKELCGEAERLYSNQDYANSRAAAASGILLLREYIGWPILFRALKPRGIVDAHLHYIWAASEIQLRRNDAHSLSPEDVEIILSSVRRAIGHLCRFRGTLKMIGAACFLHNEVVTDNHKEISAETRRFALEYAEMAKNVALQLRDRKMLAAALRGEVDMWLGLLPEDHELAARAEINLLHTLKILQEFAHEQGIRSCQIQLARLYLLPHFRKWPSSFEKSLCLSFDALKKGPQEIGLQEHFIFTVIGDAYAYRVYGNPDRNQLSALTYYASALEPYTPTRNAEIWAGAVLGWARILLRSEKAREELGKITERLDAILSTTHNRKPEVLFEAAELRFRVSALEGSEDGVCLALYREQLLRIRSVLSKRQNSSLPVEVEFRLISIDGLTDTKENTRKYLDRVVELVEKTDMARWPVQYIEARLLLAYLNFRLLNWKMGSEHADIAMKYVVGRMENDLKGIAREYYFIPAGREMVGELPFGMLMAGEVAKAILYFDLIYSRKLDANLELLLLLEKQGDADFYRKKYTNMRQQACFLDFLEVEERASKLLEVEKASNELDALRLATPNYTRRHFLSCLDDEIKHLECWVFVPMLGTNESRFLLIPPRSSLSSVVVSPVQQNGYLSELIRLADRKRKSGWLKVFADLGDTTLESEFDLMRAHLWSAYGQWIVDVIVQHQMEGLPHVCILAAGALALFPFALAEAPKSGKRLLDYVSISYAPSLYGIFSIEHRLKDYREPPSIVCVNGRRDADTPFADHQMKFILGTDGKDRTVHSCDDGCSLEDVGSVLSDSNHWHFSGHGQFQWGSAGYSRVELPCGHLPAGFIDMMEPRAKLRLVVLTSCETAIHDFLHSDADVEEFRSNFLSLGALGVLAPLWRLPDDSAALFTERFYHYYFQNGRCPAAALRSAQLWLRDATKSEVVDLMEKHHGLASRDIWIWKDNLHPYDDEDRPFEDPRFWAGMMLVGR